MAVLRTDLLGKVNNLADFKGEALLPVFEAVANSIQAIEERGNVTNGRIVVRVIRLGEVALPGFEEDTDDAIQAFEIEDNGIGFDDTNYESFLTAETTHKLAKGGKGVGRFFWLKAFDDVQIRSVFSNGEGKRFVRGISFSTRYGIKQTGLEETEEELRTVVRLSGFRKEYREQPSAYKTHRKIAQRILEHCLAYWIAGNAPEMVVEDCGAESYCISLADLFGRIRDDITEEHVPIDGQEFHVSHIRLFSTHAKMHNLVLCGNNRDVQTISLSKLLGTSTQFDDSDRKFIYSAYVTSPYLDKHVEPSRLAFTIPQTGPLLSGTYSLSLDEIVTGLGECSRQFLAEYLDAVRKRKEELVDSYVSTTNPSLRAVPRYCPEAFEELEPNASEEKIDEVLYKHKGRAELEIRKRSEKLLKTQAASMAEIQQEYDELSGKLDAFQRDQLSAYIVFRKMVIDLLDRKLELDQAGKYSNEDIVHDILFPRKSTTEELGERNHNLWLLDERLTFHSFAASDCRLCDTTDSDSEERPDIAVYAQVDDDRIAREVSLVELKKPQRTQFSEDPAMQLLRYVRKIRDRRVKLPSGRNLQVADSTRFYCYSVCDITAAIEEFAENGNYAQLKGQMGYYSYIEKLNAHVEILAFDKLVVDAKQRHRAFFEMLGI